MTSSDQTTLPPYYYNDDPHSFGFSTCRSRWVKILKNIVEDTESEINSSKSNELKKSQGAEIIGKIENLSKDLANDAKLTPFTNDSIPGLKSFNETLSKLKNSPDGPRLKWLTGPWLFLECWLYREVDVFYKERSEWTNFDVFERLKRETFFSSTLGVYELVNRYKKLQDGKAELIKDQELLKVVYEEFIEISLWGNATDLSLLANATLEDIKSVQGSAARAKSRKNIIANDLDLTWDRITISAKLGKPRRVDFVLDNAGFEFFTDVCLSLFLLDFGLVDEVVYHCKTRPWMVSDTMIKDVKIMIDDLLDTSKFPEHRSDIQFFVDSFTKYQNSGQIKTAESEFWTIDLDYGNISPEETQFGGAELWKYFQDSTLVIIKGDLNYRKLTADRHWPRDTPFTTAIGKLADSGIHLVALRTCKADVCAGLSKGKDEELCEYWKSLGNEYGELWCSSGKWAVISYSSGSKK
ncbi:unnamed protein product [Ambrosiozyma monospora]|uniref:Unnamed protein product n=1 Tax=Ambrosiozyma monospora TaxID=43982 RepID=A0ACB5SQZ4_AMBMO|nr:unnamed protein product [Ambrosiozyma monospora]